MDIRMVHPRPQFCRERWISLDGEWDFSFDFSNSGKERNWCEAVGFEGKIRIPFAPESKLSGVGYTDFIEHLWYHRKLVIPGEWQSGRQRLHFGGVDYRCEIYLDGIQVGSHTGLDSFWVDIEAEPGSEHDLVVWVEDLIRSHQQPFGKQSPRLISAKCNYTRTTGIHQTVFLEELPESFLESSHIIPDFDGGKLIFIPELRNQIGRMKLTVIVSGNGKKEQRTAAVAVSGVPVTVELENPEAWSPENPFLYDVTFELTDADGRIVDRVFSYAGLRKFHIEKERFYLNNRPIYLRLVLDQGFYPEGIWTAPDDKALKHDIELALAAGFNGARLHEKIFSERFHYWADKLGYLTWAEFPDWGIGFWHHFTPVHQDFNGAFRDYYAQWSAVVKRDRNHPSIISWTPFNETCSIQDLDEHRRIIRDIAALTRTLDPTRPVNDTSGYVHEDTDIWTVHTYMQDPEKLAEALAAEPVYKSFPERDRGYCGQPLVPDEYGGVRFVPEAYRKDSAANAWGYSTSEDARSAEKKIAELTGVVLQNERCAGYCYTQLTDIEQEQNGIYNYDRTAKFDMETIRSIFGKKPSWSC